MAPAVHEVWSIPWGVSQEQFLDYACQKTRHNFWPYPELKPRGFFIWHPDDSENVWVFGLQPSIIHALFEGGKFSTLTVFAFCDIDITDTEQVTCAFDSLHFELSSRYEPSSPPMFIYNRNEDGETYFGIIPFNLAGRMDVEFLRLLMQNEPQSILYIEYDNIYAEFSYEFDTFDNQFYFEIKLVALSQYSSMSMWETLENDPSAYRIDNYMEYIQSNPTPVPKFTPTPIPAPIRTPSLSPDLTPSPSQTAASEPIILDF